MTLKKITQKVLIWLPSLVVMLFHMPNALEKIIKPNQLDKVTNNTTIIVIVGVVLLIANILFLINKTMIIGTTILSLYLSGIIIIHMLKGKPHEVVMLITMSTVFAAYLRNPSFFHPNKA